MWQWKRLVLVLVLWKGGMGYGLHAQIPGAPPPVPAQLVVIFENEPTEFKALSLNKAPFASLQVPIDAATIWPVAAGKKELVVSAPGAEDKKLALALNPKEVSLLMLGLKSNPDPAKKSEHPKIITAELSALDLPVPDKQGRIFVYIPPGFKNLQAMEHRGKANPKPVELKSGRLTSIGVGSVAVMVGEQQVVAASPGNPGLYVFVVFPGADGKLRSLPVNFLVEEPEAPPSP